MPLSGVDPTPRPAAVYASNVALPRRPQDSLPSCLLGFGRTQTCTGKLASASPIAPRIRLSDWFQPAAHGGAPSSVCVAEAVGDGRRAQQHRSASVFAAG